MPESTSFLSRLISELKRRKVPRVAAAYLAVAAAAIGSITAAVSALHLPEKTAALVVLFALLGFPVAIVVSWVFDFTPEGVKRTEEEAEERLVPSRLARMALLGLTVLVTGWAGVAFWNSRFAGNAAVATDAPVAAPLDPNHVAVLYLRDDTPDHSLVWLAHGLTDNLIQRLGGVAGLTVVPPNGVKEYRGAGSPSIDSIGRLLNAGSVVQGSVQGSGDRVRVNIQLVNASTGDQVASQPFEGSQGDPFALEDSVSQQVSRYLRKQLGRVVEIGRQKKAAHDPQAWKLYQVALERRDDAASLRAAQDTSGAMRLYQRADSLLDSAAALDPGWYEPTLESGWTHLAMSRVQAVTPRQADRALLGEGIRDANRVLARDSGNASALELRGNLRWFLSRTASGPRRTDLLDSAERDLRAATAADPGLARAWAVLAYILRNRGKFEEARLDGQHMREADPYLANDGQYLYVSAMLALEFHQIERADSLFARGEVLYPNAPTFVTNRLVIVASRPYRPGAVDTAWARLRRARSRMPPGSKYQEGPFMVAATLARAGLRDSAKAVEQRAWDMDPGSTTAEQDGAYVALQLGERQRALDLLGRYLDHVPQDRPYVARDWWWDKLHEDPRFQAMVDTTRTPAR